MDSGTIEEIVGPLETFTASEAIARARAKAGAAYRGRYKEDKPTTADEILAEIAATILDGSIPLEEALKKAETMLKETDPEALAGDLQERLEAAMFEAAQQATGKARR